MLCWLCVLGCTIPEVQAAASRGAKQQDMLLATLPRDWQQAVQYLQAHPRTIQQYISIIVASTGIEIDTSLPPPDVSSVAATDRACWLLVGWLVMHRLDPYPNRIEKELLSMASGMKVEQVDMWFRNRRRGMGTKRGAMRRNHPDP